MLVLEHDHLNRSLGLVNKKCEGLFLSIRSTHPNQLRHASLRPSKTCQTDFRTQELGPEMPPTSQVRSRVGGGTMLLKPSCLSNTDELLKQEKGEEDEIEV